MDNPKGCPCCGSFACMRQIKGDWEGGRNADCFAVVCNRCKTQGALDLDEKEALRIWNGLPRANEMPWARDQWRYGALKQFVIIAMNHYFIKGKRHLFVTMGYEGVYIKDEGEDEHKVFESLAKQAQEIIIQLPENVQLAPKEVKK